MKTVYFALILFLSTVPLFGQYFSVTEDGILSQNGDSFVVISSDSVGVNTLMDKVHSALSANSKSTNMSIERLNGRLVVRDIIAAYTKTDGFAGSNYLFDLSYKFTIDFKDNRIKINAPVISISASQKYDSNTSKTGSSSQFSITMGIKGKKDIWGDKEKRFFIYTEKGKLKEKTTKIKLEKTFDDFISIVKESLLAHHNEEW